MAKATYVLHRGTGFPIPKPDKWHPPTGEITWFEAETAAVSTCGPSLAISMDITVPRARGREQIIVIRLRDAHDYLPSSHPDFTDPDDWLAVSAVVTIPQDGTAEGIDIAIPYTALPANIGGLLEVEIAVHDPPGMVTAIDYQGVQFPDDFDRSPDAMTVISHTLVALVRATSPITREEVRTIREHIVESFELDDMGDASLRRILKKANQVEHSHETLAEVIQSFVPAHFHYQLVSLLYSVAKAKHGYIHRKGQRFIDRLLNELSIHDHVLYGPEQLLPAYQTLELEPGAGIKEVKKAFRTLVTAYHPDRVSHLAQGFIDFANQKIKDINNAYAELKQGLEERERLAKEEAESQAPPAELDGQ